MFTINSCEKSLGNAAANDILVAVGMQILSSAFSLNLGASEGKTDLSSLDWSVRGGWIWPRLKDALRLMGTMADWRKAGGWN